MTIDLHSDFKIERPPKDFYQVLVVDDEPASRNLLRVVLQKHGYGSVDEAASGDDALQALAAAEYHLVLLDKNLPGIDGIEVLRRGRSLRPECEFIMITAYGSLDTAIQAMDLGAYGYVTKPFAQPEEVVRRVQGALERVWIRLENAVLIDRLRMLLAELDYAERELGQSRQRAPLDAQRQTEPNRLREAILRLERLAVMLERLRAKASGKTQVLIKKLEVEAGEVVNLLVGGNVPSRKGPS
jgi:DNA-binding response OmpR family regulator